MAAALLPEAAVFTARSATCASPAMTRAVSYLSVVQDLRDVAGDKSFKHVFLGVTKVRSRWYVFAAWLRRSFRNNPLSRFGPKPRSRPRF